MAFKPTLQIKDNESNGPIKALGSKAWLWGERKILIAPQKPHNPFSLSTWKKMKSLIMALVPLFRITDCWVISFITKHGKGAFKHVKVIQKHKKRSCRLQLGKYIDRGESCHESLFFMSEILWREKRNVYLPAKKEVKIMSWNYKSLKNRNFNFDEDSSNHPS